MAKETIYIEADDEITTIIDKINSANDSIVAIVLPKRTSAFQSVVNMKLVKKAAEEAKKKIVLISSDASIDSIAALAGVHVAQSLTSKPVIPKKASKKAREATISSKELDAHAAGTLEESPADGSTEPASGSEEEPIEIDNTISKAEELPAGTLASSSPASKKRKFKIPDFSSFRLRMTLGIGAVGIIVTGWIFGFIILPKATITINSDTSSSTVTFDFFARAGIEVIDVEKGIIPATKVEVTKENKVVVPATGQKDIGEKASGQVTFSLINCSVGEVTIPSGTVVASRGQNYITTEEASMQSVVFGSICRNDDFKQFSTDTVGVVAQSAGTQFNQSAGSYTVSGYSSVSVFGSEMTGGTSQKVKVISKEDFEGAKSQLKGSANAEAVSELEKLLNDQQLQALKETVEEDEPKIKSSAAVDAEAEELTVTQTVAYRMLGVKTSDLATVLDARINTSLGDAKDKNVRNNGLDKAVYRLATKTSIDDQTINLQTVATIGPEFDTAVIASEVAGKKRGDIEKLLESRDGVRSVSVEYNPFWITTTPKSAKKITIIVNELQQ